MPSGTDSPDGLWTWGLTRSQEYLVTDNDAWFIPRLVPSLPMTVILDWTQQQVNQTFSSTLHLWVFVCGVWCNTALLISS